jgi:hypothetical protein
MFTEQMKDHLRNVTWRKPAMPFTGLLGRTMETRLHHQSRLKVLNGFTLFHWMRAVQHRAFAPSESDLDKGLINFSMSKR